MKGRLASWLLAGALVIAVFQGYALGQGDGELFEVSVKGVVVDQTTNAPIVVLQESNGKKLVPIAIGGNEAQAISMEMASVLPVRPMTHDLITKILQKVDAKVLKIVINDVRDNIVYALLYLRLQKSELVVDSRPSDAINIALRAKAAIFVTKKVRDVLAVDVPPPGKPKQEKEGFSL